jgi:hypothetical protein
METRKSFQSISALVFKAVGVAMAVAVVVLHQLKGASLDSQVMLLGIGLFCLALTVLGQEKKHE